MLSPVQNQITSFIADQLNEAQAVTASNALLPQTTNPAFSPFLLVNNLELGILDELKIIIQYLKDEVRSTLSEQKNFLAIEEGNRQIYSFSDVFSNNFEVSNNVFDDVRNFFKNAVSTPTIAPEFTSNLALSSEASIVSLGGIETLSSEKAIGQNQNNNQDLSQVQTQRTFQQQSSERPYQPQANVLRSRPNKQEVSKRKKKQTNKQHNSNPLIKFLIKGLAGFINKLSPNN